MSEKRPPMTAGPRLRALSALRRTRSRTGVAAAAGGGVGRGLGAWAVSDRPKAHAINGRASRFIAPLGRQTLARPNPYNPAQMRWARLTTAQRTLLAASVAYLA